MYKTHQPHFHTCCCSISYLPSPADSHICRVLHYVVVVSCAGECFSSRIQEVRPGVGAKRRQTIHMGKLSWHRFAHTGSLEIQKKMCEMSWSLKFDWDVGLESWSPDMRNINCLINIVLAASSPGTHQWCSDVDVCACVCCVCVFQIGTPLSYIYVGSH